MNELLRVSFCDFPQRSPQTCMLHNAGTQEFTKKVKSSQLTLGKT